MAADAVSSSMSSADLENSLTEMDWLASLAVGGTLPGLGDPSNESDPSLVGQTDYVGQLSLTAGRCSVIQQQQLHQNQQQSRIAKPPYSYTNLITSAINSSPNKRMALSEIYQWIGDNYPYYKTAGPGWKVSAPYQIRLFLARIRRHRALLAGVGKQ